MTLTSTPPTIRVMLVDDSAIIRGLISRALSNHSNISIVGSAFNGAVALELLKRTPVDIILLDIEMPEMDGLTALPKMLELSPSSRIIMISTLTQRNAEISLKALSLGASDYIAKPTSAGKEQELESFYRELVDKINALANHHLSNHGIDARTVKKSLPNITPVQSQFSGNIAKYPQVPIRALAIGSSTGGPQALLTLFKGLAAGHFSTIPIFITQHMPPTFTTLLAQHIGQVAGRACVEATENEIVKSNTIYLAPGDYHMVPEKSGANIVIRLNKNPPVNFCRPAVDPMLDGLREIYGNQLLVAILTGMGSDGFKGSQGVVKAGGTVIAQNEQTCVVWGMPRAVTENNLCSAVLPLEDIAAYCIKACT